jgi:hypothetical protein
MKNYNVRFEIEYGLNDSEVKRKSGKKTAARQKKDRK